MTGLNLDEMLARVTTLNATNTTQARTYLTDALGSVIAQTQDNQSILAGYSYSPYGQTQSTGNTEGDSVQYTGRENDNNGLYYYRARYYDPVLKRFLSEDPIGLAGGSLSFYAYVNGNPVQFVDPEGLSPHGTEREPGLEPVCIECIFIPVARVASNLSKLLKPKSKNEEFCPPSLTPAQREALQRELDHLKQVEKELRIQLDNGRRQAARELSQGRAPNPHGLGKEINDLIPNEINKVIKRIREINQALGR